MPYEFIDAFPHEGIVTTPPSEAAKPTTSSLILNMKFNNYGHLETRHGVRMFVFSGGTNFDPDNWNSIGEKPKGATLLTEYVLSHVVPDNNQRSRKILYYPTGEYNKPYVFEINAHDDPAARWRFKAFDRGLFFGMRKIRQGTQALDKLSFLTYYYYPLTTLIDENREIRIQLQESLGGNINVPHPETDAFTWSHAFHGTWHLSLRKTLRAPVRRLDWTWQDWARDTGEREDLNWIEHYQSASQYRNKLVISDRINGDLVLYDLYDSKDQLQLPKLYELILQENCNRRFDVNIVEVDFQLCADEKNGKGVESPMALYKFYFPKKKARVSNDHVTDYRFTNLIGVELTRLLENFERKGYVIDSDIICRGIQTFFYGFTCTAKADGVSVGGLSGCDESSEWKGFANFWTVQRNGQYFFSNWDGSSEEFIDVFDVPTLKNPDVESFRDPATGILVEEKAADVFLWEDYKLTYRPCSGTRLGEYFLRYGDMQWNKLEPIRPRAVLLRTATGFEQELRIGGWQYRFVWDYGDGEYSAPSAPLSVPELLWSAYSDGTMVQEVTQPSTYMRWVTYRTDGTDVDLPLKVVDNNQLTVFGNELKRFKEFIYDEIHPWGGAAPPDDLKVTIVSFLDSPDVECQGSFAEGAHLIWEEKDAGSLQVQAAHVHKLCVPAFKTNNYEWWKNEPLFTTRGRYRWAWRRQAVVPRVDFVTNNPDEVGTLQPQPFPIASLASFYIVPYSPTWKLFSAPYFTFTGLNEELCAESPDFNCADDELRNIRWYQNKKTTPITIFADGGNFYLNIATDVDQDYIDDRELDNDPPARRYTIYRGTMKQSERLSWFSKPIPQEVRARILGEGFVELRIMDNGDNVTFYANEIEGAHDHFVPNPLDANELHGYYIKEYRDTTLYVKKHIDNNDYYYVRDNRVFNCRWTNNPNGIDFNSPSVPPGGIPNTYLPLNPAARATLLPLFRRLRFVVRGPNMEFLNGILAPFVQADYDCLKNRDWAKITSCTLRQSEREWILTAGIFVLREQFMDGERGIPNTINPVIYTDPATPKRYNAVYNTWNSVVRRDYRPDYIYDFVADNLGVYVYLPTERLLFPEQFTAYFTSKMLFDAPRVMLRIKKENMPPRAKRILIFRTRAIDSNDWQPNQYGLVDTIELNRDENGLLTDFEYFDDVADVKLDFSTSPENYEVLDRPLASRFNAVMNERVYYANFIEEYLPVSPRGWIAERVRDDSTNCRDVEFKVPEHIVNARLFLDTWKIDNSVYNDKLIDRGYREPPNPLSMEITSNPALYKDRIVRYFLVYKDADGNFSSPELDFDYPGSQFIDVVPSNDRDFSANIVEVTYSNHGADPQESSHVVAAVGVEIAPTLHNDAYKELRVYRQIIDIQGGNETVSPFYYIGKFDDNLPTVFVDNGLENKEKWNWYRTDNSGNIDYTKPYAPIIREEKVDYVRWSDTYAPSTLRAENIEGVRAGDGTQITGMVPTYNGNLLIFKEHSMVRWMTGGGFDVVRRDQVSEEYGCISPNGYAAFGEDIYFMSSYGLMRYDDNRIYRADGPVADEIQRLIKQYDTGILHPGVRDITMAIEPRAKILYINIPILDTDRRIWDGYDSFNRQYDYDATENLYKPYLRGHIYVLHLDTGQFTKYSYRTGIEGSETNDWAFWDRYLARLYHVDSYGRLWSAAVIPTTLTDTLSNNYSHYEQTPIYLETGHGDLEYWSQCIDDYIPLPRIGETVTPVTPSTISRLPVVSIYATAILRAHPSMLKRIRKFVVAVETRLGSIFTAYPTIAMQTTYHDRSFAQYRNMTSSKQFQLPEVYGDAEFIPDFAEGISEVDRARFLVRHEGQMIVRGSGIYWRPVHSYLG